MWPRRTRTAVVQFPPKHQRTYICIYGSRHSLANGSIHTEAEEGEEGEEGGGGNSLSVGPSRTQRKSQKGAQIFALDY